MYSHSEAELDEGHSFSIQATCLKLLADTFFLMYTSIAWVPGFFRFFETWHTRFTKSYCVPWRRKEANIEMKKKR